MATFLGSRWKMVTTAGTTAAVVLFFVLLPSLIGAGIGTLVKLAFYQAWTLGILLLVTGRVRSIGVGAVARYWLAGTFLVAMLASLLNDPLAGLADQSVVWITPLLEELLKVIPIGIAIVMGRRAWRHPGLSDLMILGFGVGAGYAFHEEALWERAGAAGFGFDAGLVVPSIVQTEGLTIVGQAVWTSMLAFAIGLLVLHRRQAGAVVGAVALILLVVGDHMAANGGEGSLEWVRQLLFDGTLSAVLFIVAVAAAVALDQRRLAAASARDHLFPSNHTHGPSLVDDADDDPLAPVLASRYRRLRNGMHTTVDATTQQWPPRSEAHPAPLAELARLGRAADVAVGPGTSPSGWAADPESHGSFRFVGPNGFTAYVAGEHVAEPTAIPVPAIGPEFDPAELDGAEVDGAEVDEATRARRAEAVAAAAAFELAVAIGPTAATISSPKARPEAKGSHLQQRASDFWQYLGVGAVGVGLFVLVRLLTAGVANATVLETPISLPDAHTSPALVVGILGAIATAASLRGRNAAELNEGWEVGPGYDPSADRPDECEA